MCCHGLLICCYLINYTMLNICLQKYPELYVYHFKGSCISVSLLTTTIPYLIINSLLQFTFGLFMIHMAVRPFDLLTFPPW